MNEERVLIVERDHMTGWRRRIPNYADATHEWPRAAAEGSVVWREKNIVGRYGYSLEPSDSKAWDE